MTAPSPRELDALIDAQLPTLVALRHDLHAHPQLAFEETFASALVQRELTAAGVPFAAGLAATGVVGWLTPGNRNDTAAIALRADMDALPIAEETGLPYASTRPHCMHACGHDGHTAILLGAARVLSRCRERLPRPVKFLFQPAEEGGGGARKLIEAGALDVAVGGIAVAETFGLHGWPAAALGTVSTRPGPFMASTDLFRVTVRGRGGHGAMPHLVADPILAAAHLVTALQSIVSRNVDTRRPAVVSVGSIHAGIAENVIPDTAQFTGTIRALEEPVAQQIHERLQQMIPPLAAALGCEAQVQIERGYPATHNDPAFTARVRALVEAPGSGLAFVEHARPEMVAEDFSYYGRQVPACFAYLGVRDPGREDWPALHTSRYDFNDAALALGVKLMCQVALAERG